MRKLTKVGLDVGVAVVIIVVGYFTIFGLDLPQEVVVKTSTVSVVTEYVKDLEEYTTEEELYQKLAELVQKPELVSACKEILTQWQIVAKQVNESGAITQQEMLDEFEESGFLDLHKAHSSCQGVYVSNPEKFPEIFGTP